MRFLFGMLFVFVSSLSFAEDKGIEPLTVLPAADFKTVSSSMPGTFRNRGSQRPFHLGLVVYVEKKRLELTTENLQSYYSPNRATSPYL